MNNVKFNFFSREKNQFHGRCICDGYSFKLFMIAGLLVFGQLFVSNPAGAQSVNHGKSLLVPPFFLFSKGFPFKTRERFRNLSQDRFLIVFDTKLLSGKMELFSLFAGEEVPAWVDLQVEYATQDADDEIVSTEQVNCKGYNFMLDLHSIAFCDENGKGTSFYYIIRSDSSFNGHSAMRIYLKSYRMKDSDKLRKKVLKDLSCFRDFHVVNTQFYDRLREPDFPRRKLMRNANKGIRDDVRWMKQSFRSYQLDSTFITSFDLRQRFYDLTGGDKLPEFDGLLKQRKFDEMMELTRSAVKNMYYDQCNRLEQIWIESDFTPGNYLKLRNDLMQLQFDQNELFLWLSGSKASGRPLNLCRYVELNELINTSNYKMGNLLTSGGYQLTDLLPLRYSLGYAFVRKIDDEYFPNDMRRIQYVQCISTDSNSVGFVYTKEAKMERDKRYYLFGPENEAIKWYYLLYRKEANGVWTTALSEIPDKMSEVKQNSMLFGNSVLITQHEGSSLYIPIESEQTSSSVDAMKLIYFPNAKDSDTSYAYIASGISFAGKDYDNRVVRRLMEILGWSRNPKLTPLDSMPVVVTSDEEIFYTRVNGADIVRTYRQTIEEAHNFPPGQILFKTDFKISDLNHDGTPECYRYSISNGKLIEVDCYTLVNNEPVAVSREEAERWLQGEFEFRTLMLYSQLRGE